MATNPMQPIKVLQLIEQSYNPSASQNNQASL